MSRQAAKPAREEESREPDEASDTLASVALDAALEVHPTLEPAFLESVYENAFCHELSLRRVSYLALGPRLAGQLGRASTQKGVRSRCPDAMTPHHLLAAWRLGGSLLLLFHVMETPQWLDAHRH